MAISTLSGIGGEEFYTDLFTKMARMAVRRTPKYTGRCCCGRMAVGRPAAATLLGRGGTMVQPPRRASAAEARAPAWLPPAYAGDARTHSAEQVAQRAAYRLPGDRIAPNAGGFPAAGTACSAAGNLLP
jgi:hypothetical protein